MEALKQQIEQRRLKTPAPSRQELENFCREYLQVLLLKLLFAGDEGRALSFMGGTCLRICYDLKRYSEDLDFALDDRRISYDFKKLHERLKRELKQQGFEVEISLHSEKRVQKSWLKFNQVLQNFNLAMHPKQRLHIKIEVDRFSPKLTSKHRESFFVTRFGEIFPVLKHDLPTLFAGKILAILKRPFARGRDYYDLIWYLSNQTPINQQYLNEGLKSVGDSPLKTSKQVLESLQAQIQKVTTPMLRKDLEPFLEDSSEWSWLSNYQALFDQLASKGIRFYEP